MSYFIDAIFKHYADFSGRARRREYWMFVLFNFLAAFLIGFVNGIASGLGVIGNSPWPPLGWLSIAYSLFILIPGVAVFVRRLHDVGKSGWFWLIALIPLIGAIWLLVLMCQDGDPQANRYGPNPKLAGAGAPFGSQPATMEWPVQNPADSPVSPVGANRFCSHCGTPVREGSAFCVACGARVQ